MVCTSLDRSRPSNECHRDLRVTWYTLIWLQKSDDKQENKFFTLKSNTRLQKRVQQFPTGADCILRVTDGREIRQKLRKVEKNDARSMRGEKTSTGDRRFAGHKMQTKQTAFTCYQLVCLLFSTLFKWIGLWRVGNDSDDEWIAFRETSKQIGVRVNRLKLMLDIHQRGQREPKQQLEFSRNDKTQRERIFENETIFVRVYVRPSRQGEPHGADLLSTGIFCTNSTMLKFHKTCRIQLRPILKNLLGCFLPYTTSNAEPRTNEICCLGVPSVQVQPFASMSITKSAESFEWKIACETAFVPSR